MKNLAADFPPTHVSSSSSTPISSDRTIPFYSTFSYDPHNFTGLLTDMPSNISMNETLLDSSLYISSADDSNEPSNSSDGVSGPRGPCMRVFRCLPPVYQTHSWRPLRYVPIHLAKQMAAFSRVSALSFSALKCMIMIFSARLQNNANTQYCSNILNAFLK